ncbi:winged helix-turn-helix transcriptional regulator [Archangium violaceum]|uniref:MarR family winged helix-turn-helix transcriptional regulator n=1 Tax=Archangium violaceum TaxID=83451 RepID=UPI00194DC13D|nr:MarR family winged helix-turn-helix transcriptional regulator [Archangium violaceum]QRO02053.1 winged helix-turn-helix transcriptional regulator [Archangium violaceum]
MSTSDDPLEVVHQAITLLSRNSSVRATNTFRGLSFVSYSMLAFISRSPEPTASEIAERFGLEKSTVSRQLAELEEEGLLHRAPSRSTPRMKTLSLTALGLERMSEIHAYQRALLEERFRQWPKKDVTQFSRLLWRFVSEVDTTSSSLNRPPQAGRKRAAANPPSKGRRKTAHDQASR